MLVPLVLCILTAFLILILYLHDGAVMKTCAWRMGEREVSETFMSVRGRKGAAKLLPARQAAGELEEKVILADIHLTRGEAASFSVQTLFRMMRSSRSADVRASGSVLVGPPGAASFAGRHLKLSGTFRSQRIDYADDWFKKRKKES